MAASLKIGIQVEAVIDGKRLTIGHASSPTSITVTGIKHEQILSIASVASKEILRLGTAAGDDIADFDFLMIVPSAACTLEIQGATAADNSSVLLGANVPFMLGVDDIPAYHASARIDQAATTATKLFVKPASAPMTVYVLAIT